MLCGTPGVPVRFLATVASLPVGKRRGLSGAWVKPSRKVTEYSENHKSRQRFFSFCQHCGLRGCFLLSQKVHRKPCFWKFGTRRRAGPKGRFRSFAVSLRLSGVAKEAKQGGHLDCFGVQLGLNCTLVQPKLHAQTASFAKPSCRRATWKVPISGRLLCKRKKIKRLQRLVGNI